MFLIKTWTRKNMLIEYPIMLTFMLMAHWHSVIHAYRGANLGMQGGRATAPLNLVGWWSID